MPIESNIEALAASNNRLANAVEMLVGAIAANTSLSAAFSTVEAAAASAPAAAPEAPKPTRTRRTKEQIAADEAAAAAPALTLAPDSVAETPQAQDDPFGDTEAPAAATYTIDDVREAALKLRDATSTEKAKEFIAKFGVSTIKDLPESKFADFIQKATKAVSAAAL